MFIINVCGWLSQELRKVACEGIYLNKSTSRLFIMKYMQIFLLLSLSCPLQILVIPILCCTHEVVSMIWKHHVPAARVC